MEDGAVLVAEERHQDLVLEVRGFGVPVDVEPPGIAGVHPPFEHVEPERIVGAADAHVVGHEIEDLAEPMRV